MAEIKLEKRYPHSRVEDITDAFMRGYEQGYKAKEYDRQNDCDGCKFNMYKEGKRCEGCCRNYADGYVAEQTEPQTECTECRFVGTYDTQFPCATCARKTKDYYEPQTERSER